MKQAGFRIYNRINRPDAELVAGFAGLPVANISDNMGRIACMSGDMRPYNGRPLLGAAFTVKLPPGDNLLFHKALSMAQPGDVLVVDGEGCLCHSLCGEIMMRTAIMHGLAGFVINGCIRDRDSVTDLDLSVYALGVNPKGPYKNGPGEIGAPVAVGGIVVHPGDIVAGDGDGVVVIRPADAADILHLTQLQFEKEQRIMEQIAGGNVDTEWIEQALSTKDCQILDQAWGE